MNMGGAGPETDMTKEIPCAKEGLELQTECDCLIFFVA